MMPILPPELPITLLMHNPEILSESDVSADQAPLVWSWPVRLGVSLLLIIHLAALVVGPSSVEPSSYLSVQTWQVFRPYLDAAYLNHGYHFFAPEPGPSHL